MDRIQATPRVNPTIGGLADLLASSYSPQRTQQMQGLMNFLGVPAVAQTLDRLSYGEPITTGRGMTTELRDEAKSTLGALLGLVPIGRAAAPAAEAATMAAGRAGERVASRVVPQVMERGGLPAEMLGAMAQGTQSPATVYHGTPHLFSRFDSSKIGTGEGNQSFGYGLYLAENPEVAQQYSRIGQIAEIDGVPVSGTGSRFSNAEAAKNLGINQSSLDRLALSNFDVGKTLKELDDEYAAATTAGDKAFVMQQIGDLKRIMKSDVNVKAGNLMQVDLPDEQIARMLDWDKPLSEQAPEVQSAIFSDIDAAIAQTKQALATASPRRSPTTAAELEKLQRERSRLANLSGGDYYKQQSLGTISEQPNASNKLRQAGIPGIRFLDQGSRGAGQGTSNFVVFPGMEDMLRIEQINNQPIESLFQNLGR